MEQKQKVFITIIVLLLVVAAFYFTTKAITQYTGYAVNTNSSSTTLDDFNKCLAAKGAVMYGAYWCPHCQNQKKTLGDSKYIPYIECAQDGENAQPEKCEAAGISGYPTWQIAGNLYPGEKTLQELSQLTGCKI